VEEFMDELGLEKAHILGHSLGGKAAMELAMRSPQRINKLVVLDIAPVQYSAHHDDVFAALMAIEPQALKTRKEAEEIFKRYLPEPSLRSFLLKNLQRDEQEGFSWRINLPVLYRDYDKILMGNSAGNFSGPVLFIKGELSNYVQEVHRKEIQKRFPNVQLKVLAGAGHWLHAEKPEIVSNIVLRFLMSN
jgi:esterase